MLRSPTVRRPAATCLRSITARSATSSKSPSVSHLTAVEWPLHLHTPPLLLRYNSVGVDYLSSLCKKRSPEIRLVQNVGLCVCCLCWLFLVFVFFGCLLFC